MKTVVFDSAFVETVTLPAIGRQFTRGVPQPLTDEQAEIALKNPDVRLESDTETPTQKARREQNQEFVTKIDEQPASGLTVVAGDANPAPPKPGTPATEVFPVSANSSQS